METQNTENTGTEEVLTRKAIREGQWKDECLTTTAFVGKKNAAGQYIWRYNIRIKMDFGPLDRRQLIVLTLKDRIIAAQNALREFGTKNGPDLLAKLEREGTILKIDPMKPSSFNTSEKIFAEASASIEKLDTSGKLEILKKLAEQFGVKIPE